MDKRIVSKEDRVAQSIARYGSKYGYDLVAESVGSKAEISLQCHTCGDVFISTWNRHLNKRTKFGGCHTCGRVECGKQLGETQEGFISKAVAKHGSRYGYDMVEFSDNLAPVKILCSDHGYFEQRPDKHKGGHGCPRCSKNGFRVDRRGFLYILNNRETPSTVKVGITNRPIPVRMREINAGKGKFVLNWAFPFVIGADCIDVETRLLQFMRATYEPLDDKFNGSTECFTGVAMDRLIYEAEKTIEKVVYGR